MNRCAVLRLDEPEINIGTTTSAVRPNLVLQKPFRQATGTPQARHFSGIGRDHGWQNQQCCSRFSMCTDVLPQPLDQGGAGTRD